MFIYCFFNSLLLQQQLQQRVFIENLKYLYSHVHMRYPKTKSLMARGQYTDRIQRYIHIYNKINNVFK